MNTTANANAMTAILRQISGLEPHHQLRAVVYIAIFFAYAQVSYMPDGATGSTSTAL